MNLLVSKPTAELLEREWTEQIIGTKNKPGVARQVGFRCYHTYRSKRSEPGFPDWVLLRERVVYLELKTQGGKLSQAQKDWVLAFLAAGAEVYVSRPTDLGDVAKVLACHGDPFMRRDVADVAARLREKTRAECS